MTNGLNISRSPNQGSKTIEERCLGLISMNNKIKSKGQKENKTFKKRKGDYSL